MATTWPDVEHTHGFPGVLGSCIDTECHPFPMSRGYYMKQDNFSLVLVQSSCSTCPLLCHTSSPIVQHDRSVLTPVSSLCPCCPS